MDSIFRKASFIYESDVDINEKPLALDVMCDKCNELIQYRISIDEALRETIHRPCPACGQENTHYIPTIFRELAIDSDRCNKKRAAERERIRAKREADPSYGQIKRFNGYICVDDNTEISAVFNVRLQSDGNWDGYANLEWRDLIGNERVVNRLKSGTYQVRQDDNLLCSYIQVRELIWADSRRPRLNFGGVPPLMLK